MKFEFLNEAEQKDRHCFSYWRFLLSWYASFAVSFPPSFSSLITIYSSLELVTMKEQVTSAYRGTLALLSGADVDPGVIKRIWQSLLQRLQHSAPEDAQDIEIVFAVASSISSIGFHYQALEDAGRSELEQLEGEMNRMRLGTDQSKIPMPFKPVLTKKSSASLRTTTQRGRKDDENWLSYHAGQP